MGADASKAQSPPPTTVKLSASSTQAGNPLSAAIDGDPDTRWCASGGSYPHWLQLEFDAPRTVTGLRIEWERPQAYQFKVEGSADGKSWQLVLDHTANMQAKLGEESIAKPTPLKYLRITGLGAKQHGGWCSIRELVLKGDGLTSLKAADSEVAKNDVGKKNVAKSNGKSAAAAGDQFAKEGNIPPRIEKLTAEQEAAILRDVKVPGGFDVTLFASPPAVNYPVFVAAAPDGTLFVSSDGNGSLGRQPHRGRVIRLRDLDGDGRADETKVFCEVDAPRGLVWDHDRLYLMHPPHLSVYIDKNGDGVSDEEQVLVKGLAFGYADRPADHTTNGMSMGLDGYLYVAGGDFGFLNAEGADGRKLTHRGGGVIRVRTDGGGLEIYSTGTRNILEVAISPQMELFARDNTNDGGGWDVRFHHFLGGEDHGYPRLYKNFGDECVPPLADYGGGSGCGAVYIDEPGLAEWNHAPFSADWGTGALYKHSVQPSGATYAESEKPTPFIKMTRPTDADVDGMSRVYCASWKGATFNWEGPNVGYIVCVKPQGYQPPPLPNFEKLSDAELVKLFDSDSYRRRLAAQRELARRGSTQAAKLLEKGVAGRTDLRKLAAKITSDATDAEVVAALAHADSIIVHLAARAAAQRSLSALTLAALDKQPTETGVLRALSMMHEPAVVIGLIERLQKSQDSAERQGLLMALCRLYYHEGPWKGDSWGTRPDTRGPYYQPETWAETPRIQAALKAALAAASPDEAAFLVRQLNRHRIQSHEALDRILALAEVNPQLVGEAISQMAAIDPPPAHGIPLVLKAALDANTPTSVLSAAIGVLSKADTSEAAPAILAAVVALEKQPSALKDFDSGRNVFLAATKLENHVAVLEQAAQSIGQQTAVWGDAALVTLTSRPNISKEAKAAAQSAIDTGWQTPARRAQIIDAVNRIRIRVLDDRILQAVDDPDPKVAKLAKQTVEKLKIQKFNDTTPKLEKLSLEQALAETLKTKGDASRGEVIFTKANCIACHTTSKDQPQKGPFLGNIAKTYKRPDLAIAILQPSKTIAQGFATNVIVTSEGKVVTGFVTLESSDKVILRDAQAKEIVINKDDIDERGTQTISMMPEGLLKQYSVRELSSLLDYLESLAGKTDAGNTNSAGK